MVGRQLFPLGVFRPSFRGGTVCFGEGINIESSWPTLSPLVLRPRRPLRSSGELTRF